VREAVASGLFAGVVTGLALSDGRTQIQAVGRRDLETGAAMAPDTLFWIASLTKSMTSTLVMMLVEEGKITLDAPVERYLPEFGRQTVPGWFGLAAKPRRPATVVELLRHLSGLPERFPPDERPLDRMTLAEKSRLCGGLRLVSQPGESHLYSNLGYEALGRLIEVVSGDSFETFLQARLLDPLGMRETTFRPTAAQLERLALPYASEGEPAKLARRPFTLVSEPFDDAERQPTPAFGLFSTAEDCLRFCRLHLQHGEWQGRRLFSNATAAQMLRRFEGPVGAEYRGLAWSVAPGAACMTGAYGTWMTLHLRLDVASVFLSASADFWQSVPQEACRAFVGNVGAELRQERLARRRRTAAARPNAANRRRPLRQTVEG
jgi:CubicO group peptidase (beta-lactamase class C family)